jgi:acyl-CoA thioester hydrolase
MVRSRRVVALRGARGVGLGLVATWITASDRKLRVTRRFVVHRTSDNALLARATTDYVCINLDTGRATRMPELFTDAYVLTRAI